MRKIAVIFGGKSCENEISVLTGVFALNLVDGAKYTAYPVYIDKDGTFYHSPKMTDLNTFRKKKREDFIRVFFDGGWLYELKKDNKRVRRIAKIDVMLNCCHGGWGEGGGVSALAEANGIPLAAPDLTASGVFMDKNLTKTVARAFGVPVVDFIRVNESDYKRRGAFLLKTVSSKLKYPVIVKPAHLGSSIGICVARTEEELRTAIESGFALDSRLVIEKYLTDKRDINCAAYTLRGEICVSEPEAAFGAGVYSFEDKYIRRTTDNKGGERGFLHGELRDKIRSYTRTLYKRMDLKGVVRMDFLVSGGKVYLCEVNTVPGSLAYYLFCERISDAKAFITDLIEEAVFSAEQSNKEILSTGILETVRATRK